MPAPASFHVAGPDTGRPLLDFVAGRLSISKKKAKQLLDDRLVFVNRQRIWMARHPLERGDIVEIHLPAAPSPQAALRILYRDSDYVVIDKPPGLLSNGDRSAETQLREQLDVPELQAVHRLDRDTSGCLLFATRPAAREAIIPMFKERDLAKSYHALVFGPFPKDMVSIASPIDGKPARTNIRVLASARTASHLDVEIETGRTHQIRKHLAGAGHPVIGDKTYAVGIVEADQLRGVTRQMLHAAEIAFEQPLTHAPLRIRAPLPPDFSALARRLNIL